VAHIAARVIVVAGADSDEGRDLARAAAVGAEAIVLCGRDATALGALAGELQDDARVRVAVFSGNMRDDADRAALREMVDELFGPL
jgi:short-subunit dehydrogenase